MDNFSSEKDKAQAMAIANLSKTIPTAALSQPTVSEGPSKRECMKAAEDFVKADHCKAAFYKGARWMLERLKGVVGSSK